MVISQIAGLATAFGTGELSGAGFGPNYTILMKLGYEFFAPRILEEMEKNPNVFFQDTLWFQKFQKQIKLYSDTVMHETLDTLINIPQKTIDAIVDKYKEEGTGVIPSVGGAPNIPTTVSPALNQIITLTKVAESLISAIQNMNFTFNIIPEAFGHEGGTTTPTESTLPIDSGKGSAPTQVTQSGINISFITLSKWRYEDLNNARSAISQGNSQYTLTTQNEIIRLWKLKRPDSPREAQLKRGIGPTPIGVTKTPGVVSKRRRTKSSDLELANLLRALSVLAKRFKAGPRFWKRIDSTAKFKKDISFLQQKIINHQSIYSL